MLACYARLPVPHAHRPLLFLAHFLVLAQNLSLSLFFLAAVAHGRNLIVFGGITLGSSFQFSPNVQAACASPTAGSVPSPTNIAIGQPRLQVAQAKKARAAASDALSKYRDKVFQGKEVITNDLYVYDCGEYLHASWCCVVVVW